MSMDQALMDLTSVTSLHMFGRVLLHGWPKIPKVKQLLEKLLLALMIPTFTLKCTYPTQSSSIIFIFTFKFIYHFTRMNFSLYIIFTFEF